MKPELIDRTINKGNSQEGQSEQTLKTTKPKPTYQVPEKEENIINAKIETKISEELNSDISHLEEQSDQSIFKVTETCKQFLEVKIETEESEEVNNHAGNLSCCHICQSEAPGKRFYGGICCCSCR